MITICPECQQSHSPLTAISIDGPVKVLVRPTKICYCLVGTGPYQLGIRTHEDRYMDRDFDEMKLSYWNLIGYHLDYPIWAGV